MLSKLITLWKRMPMLSKIFTSFSTLLTLAFGGLSAFPEFNPLIHQTIVKGVVKNQQGKSINGVTVTINGQSPLNNQTYDGKFSITSRNGPDTIILIFLKDGYEEVMTKVQIDYEKAVNYLPQPVVLIDRVSKPSTTQSTPSLKKTHNPILSPNNTPMNTSSTLINSRLHGDVALCTTKNNNAFPQLAALLSDYLATQNITSVKSLFLPTFFAGNFPTQIANGESTIIIKLRLDLYARYLCLASCEETLTASITSPGYTVVKQHYIIRCYSTATGEMISNQETTLRDSEVTADLAQENLEKQFKDYLKTVTLIPST